MKTFSSTALASAVLCAVPSGAAAQEVAGNGFVGVSAGYHNIVVDDDFGLDLNTDAGIVGVYAGYDVPAGRNLFFGVEGNFHYGFGALDLDYGVSGRAGFVSEDGTKFYARGGYQWIDIDPEGLTRIDDPTGEIFDGVDTTAGDYLVGVGVDAPLGENTVRVNLDTISFDTVRATVGFSIDF